jgi:hypothetical protein
VNYDPKLKEAMSAIEAVCKRYGCGGHITLISKTHGEFRFVLPDWAGLYEVIDENGNSGIRCKIEKAKGDTHEKAELTAHFLHSVRDIAAACFRFMSRFTEQTDKVWDTEHTPFFGFRPHRPEEH